MAFLKTKDVQDLTELSNEEIYKVISLALQLKAEGKNAVRDDLFGKTIGLIFNKPSTRTRVSFEVGAGQLGAQSIYLASGDLQLGRGESLEDTAKVLSSYLDAIVLRTFDHQDSLELGKYAEIPVINALTDLYHPCQALADLMTIYEFKNRFSDIKMAYLGDGNNVCNSLIVACAKMGIDLAVATPAGFEPKRVGSRESRLRQGFGGQAGVGSEHLDGKAQIEITNDPEKAVKGADVLYTDVWVSMGQEEEAKERLKKFQGYQINMQLLDKAKDDCMVMHCLPAHRGQEITAEVMDGKNSVIFQQAQNRLYAQKALLIGLLGNENNDQV